MTEPKPSDLEVAEKIYQKGVSGDMVSKDVVVDGIATAISEARREEGEIVHKQMDAIMDKAIEMARREALEEAAAVLEQAPKGVRYIMDASILAKAIRRLKESRDA